MSKARSECPFYEVSDIDYGKRNLSDGLGSDGYVELYWKELRRPSGKAVYVIEYYNKKEKGKRYQRVSCVPRVPLQEVKLSAIDDFKIKVHGHFEPTEDDYEDAISSKNTSTSYLGSFTSFLFGTKEGSRSYADEYVAELQRRYKSIPEQYQDEVLLKMLQYLNTDMLKKRSSSISHQLSHYESKIAHQESQIRQLQNELSKERGQKLQQARLAGILQDPVERNALETDVKQYFSSHLNAFVNNFGEQAVQVQIRIVETFCGLFESTIEEMASSVLKFDEVSDLKTGIMQAYKMLGPKGCTHAEAVKFPHQGGFYHKHERFSPEEWDLFKGVMLLKAQFLRENREYTNTLIEETKKQCLEAFNHLLGPEVGHQDFARGTAELIVKMILSSNPIVAWKGLSEHDEKYTELQPRQRRDIIQKMGSTPIFNGQPITFYLLPILFTGIHETVHVTRGRVRISFQA